MRPQVVTFLFATYHKSPSSGSSVPGNAHIRTPQGTTHDFAFDTFCAIPHDGSGNQYPDPPWSLDENVTFYRDRLRQHCVCNEILGCGTYDEATDRCTSTAGDCALVDPLKTAIECYGQNYDVPTSEGAWSRQLLDAEGGNCAYGPASGVDFASWTRTWYTAQLDSIYSGLFEVWTTDTDVNLDPSTLYKRHTGQHPCTLSSTQKSVVPVVVADGALECTLPPNITHSSECDPTTDNPIISGYICGSVCPEGQVATDVYKCGHGEWTDPEDLTCIDPSVNLTCTASSSQDVSAGVVGILGDGCHQLTLEGTTCEIVCEYGMWGGGEIQCIDSSSSRQRQRQRQRRRMHEIKPVAAAAAARLDNHRANRVLDRRRLLTPSARPDIVESDGIYHQDDDDDDETMMRQQRRRRLLALSGDDDDDEGDGGPVHPRRMLWPNSDCNGKGAKSYKSRVGDGVCDSDHTNAVRNFFCSGFNYDDGDCPEETYGRDCDGNMYIAGAADPEMYYEL